MNELVSKTPNRPLSLHFHDGANSTCSQIEENMAMIHKAIDRLIPPRIRESKPTAVDPKHNGEYQPTISEQQDLLGNRLIKIQDVLADAVNRLEEFV